MDKLKPHYSLSFIQVLVQQEGARCFSFTAQRGAEQMGLSRVEAIEVVITLSPRMFYKSMTTHADSSVWQDVYHAPCVNGKTAYIKLTLQQGALVIQFKEK
jgi:motility quorum-sensing regulator / GCU-specific mRNA interferase toxin